MNQEEQTERKKFLRNISNSLAELTPHEYSGYGISYNTYVFYLRLEKTGHGYVLYKNNWRRSFDHTVCVNPWFFTLDELYIHFL